MHFSLPSRSHASALRHGYTLVEISIVVVIISLIVGGVITGQELLRAASMRATIHQMETYQASLNNFRARFEALPGDLAVATSHFAANSWPLTVNGDGDGLIEDDDFSGSETPAGEYSGEVSQFWYQLHAADMLTDRFDNGSTIGTSFPKLETGRGGVTVGAIDDSTNIWRLCAMSATVGQAMVMENCLTPEEAASIDEKLDDGKPQMGSVIAVGGTTFDGAVTFFDNASLPLPTGASFASLATHLATSFLIPQAYAADTETTVVRDACVFKDDDTGTAEQQATNAKYAIASGGINCQLKISMR